MSTINLHQTTTLTPEQYIAGLTDFGPGRWELFGNSADEYLKVHQLGRAEADVTEGSGGIWERLHYDWSDPNHVVLTTTDSNLWGGASGLPTTSRVRPTERPTLMLKLYAKARTSKDSCSASCLGPSARAFWKGRLRTASRPSKRGTARLESESRLERANTMQRARQFQSSPLSSNQTRRETIATGRNGTQCISLRHQHHD